MYRSKKTIEKISGDNENAKTDFFSRKADSLTAFALLLLAAFIYGFNIPNQNEKNLFFGLLMVIYPSGHLFSRIMCWLLS